MSVFSTFNSDLQREWRHDRALRQRIPLDDACRSSIALAAMFGDVDRNECFHDSRIFYPNENITWICMRDVPAGHFPGSKNLNKKEVNYASVSRATLCHGMPKLDFSQSRDSWDFRQIPYDRWRRYKLNGRFVETWAAGDVLNSAEYPLEFAILNRMSRTMTELAFHGVDRHGHFLRPAWAVRRPRTRRIVQVMPPREWMPVPYLGFPKNRIQELFWAATSDADCAFEFQCANCGCSNQVNRIIADRFFESGDFVAQCFGCRKQRKWFLVDAAMPRRFRKFNSAFQNGFVNAVANGLRLTVPSRSRYLGPLTFAESSTPLNDRLQLIPHSFKDANGRALTVFLPPMARIQVKPMDMLEPHQPWCTALPYVPASWKANTSPRRWASLTDVCGGKDLVGHLQHLWFQDQAVHLTLYPDLVFYPAALVALAPGVIEPTELVWEFSGADSYIDADLSAAIFPPLVLDRWNELRRCLPREVDLDAGIGDPRFVAIINEATTKPAVGRALRCGKDSPATTYPLLTSHAVLLA